MLDKLLVGGKLPPPDVFAMELAMLEDEEAAAVVKQFFKGSDFMSFVHFAAGTCKWCGWADRCLAKVSSGASCGTNGTFGYYVYHPDSCPYFREAINRFSAVGWRVAACPRCFRPFVQKEDESQRDCGRCEEVRWGRVGSSRMDGTVSVDGTLNNRATFVLPNYWTQSTAIYWDDRSVTAGCSMFMKY